MAIAWPARLAHGDVVVRPMRWRDAGAWVQLRRRNEDWLRPWEATPPGHVVEASPTARTYLGMHRELHRQARAGAALPFGVFLADRLAGQLTIGNVVRGSLNSAYAGYWVDREVAGRGLMPVALALALEHCFGAAGLHRVEANIRPENAASRRVVEKLGFRCEGLRERYLHIDGAYRDHLCYALTAEEAVGGLLRRVTQR